MFGRNKISSEEFEGIKNQLEEASKICSSISDKGEIVGANLEAMEGSGDRLDSDIKQVFENNDLLISNTEKNIERAASLLFTLESISDELAVLEENNLAVIDSISNQHHSIEELVDSNKHFTSPSKELKEVAPKILDHSKDIRCSLTKMEDISKQMSVLSLNAAIEAGRLGDAAMDFVKAADEVRIFTNNYNEEIQVVKERLDRQDKWAAELDESLKHLISLLKDNNIATSRLIKPANELVKLSEGINSHISTDVSAAREELGAIKIVGEENLRLDERNKMQLTDIIAEYAAIRANQDEIEETLTPIFAKAGDYKAQNEREQIEREDNK